MLEEQIEIEESLQRYLLTKTDTEKNREHTLSELNIKNYVKSFDDMTHRIHEARELAKKDGRESELFYLAIYREDSYLTYGVTAIGDKIMIQIETLTTKYHVIKSYSYRTLASRFLSLLIRDFVNGLYTHEDIESMQLRHSKLLDIDDEYVTNLSKEIIENRTSIKMYDFLLGLAEEVNGRIYNSSGVLENKQSDDVQQLIYTHQNKKIKEDEFYIKYELNSSLDIMDVTVKQSITQEHLLVKRLNATEREYTELKSHFESLYYLRIHNRLHLEYLSYPDKIT